MNRFGMGAVVGLACIVAGLMIRGNADSWSRNDTRGHVTHSFDSVQHAFLQDVGFVLLALGVLALAAVFNRWIAGEPSDGQWGQDADRGNG